jgi:protein-disulfide isomerase
VLKEYDGRVRLIYKDFPLPSHALAMPAHEAARCAGEQGRYWAYHDVLFERQPRFERDDLVGYAVNLDLDRERFERCLDDHMFRAAVEADFAEGRELGVRSTPTFLINGKPLVGAHPIENFRAAIDDALGARR